MGRKQVRPALQAEGGVTSDEIRDDSLLDDLQGDPDTFDHAGIKALAKRLGNLKLDSLEVLKRDPFTAGSDGGNSHAEGRLSGANWYAEQVHEQLEIPPGAHMRRIHYRLVSQDQPILTLGGEPYENTERCEGVLERTSLDARYLGLVPQLVDRRNPAPVINLDDAEADDGVITADTFNEEGELQSYSEEIERYHDDTLDDRIQEVTDELQEELDGITKKVHRKHAKALAALDAERKVHKATMDAFDKKVAQALGKVKEDLEAEAPDPDEADWPECDEGDEDPDPLYDSSRTYLTQIRRYKKHQGKVMEAKPKRVMVAKEQTCECGATSISAKGKLCKDCLRKRHNKYMAEYRR
jgi:hypothetical protein